MDIDRAIAIVETVLTPKPLSSLQIQIIRGVIANKSYQEIIAAISNDQAKGSHRYKISYVKETGASLWQALSWRLGQKVTKKNLVAVLLWYSKQPEFAIAHQFRSDPPQRSKIDWGESIQRPNRSQANDAPFYGRTEELATLTSWCVTERSRLISLLGTGGMGKTTLAGKLVSGLTDHFDCAIWRSLLNAPPVTDILRDLLQFLSPQPLADLPDTVEGQIELTIAYLTHNRALVVLDNVESVLQGQVHAGQYLPGYEGYEQLFKAIGELPHQSCLLITSREKPQPIARSEVIHPKLVRSFAVGGLTPDMAHELVQSCGCPPIPAQMWQEVYTHYSGNPLALKMAAIAAIDMTGGGEAVLGLYPLMKEGKLKFQTIEDILQRQFARLSPPEQQLVYWLAIEREPVTSKELRENLVPHPAIGGEILNALQSLLRRCVAVRQEQTWSLEPVMMVYVTGKIIDEIVGELTADPSPLGGSDLQSQFWHLNNYAIIKAQTKDYLRQAQTQLILRPILNRCLVIWDTPELFSEHLRRILTRWREQNPIPLGYLAGNILNLSIELAPDGSIADLDCSGLPIWSADLVDVNLDRVNFAGAAFDRTVFTQTFGGIVSVAFHPTGDLFATGDGNGDVHLWRTSDGQRLAIYQGHANWIRSLAFTPNGNILASSGDDLTINFWDLHTGRQIPARGLDKRGFRRICFSRDGQKLFTGGHDYNVRIYHFQIHSDAQNQAIEVDLRRELVGHTHWVFSVALSPDESQLATASADSTVRIWDLKTGVCLHVLSHQHWVIRTVFSPDGRRLIVSGMSATIYVWDLSSGKLIQTLTGHTDWVWSIACTPDGKTLISAGEDRTIRMWDLDTGSCLDISRAHQQRIWAIDVSPDGQLLISGSDDRTIKICDLQRRKCLKTINGYGNWIRSISLVLDRRWLIGGYRDGLIRIWDLDTRTWIQTLAGHTAGVLSITVSPDGDYFASSGIDRTIRLWDLQDFSCIQTIEAEVEGSWCLVFSPDGSWLIAGCKHGEVQIWEIATGNLIRTLSVDLPTIQSVAICRIHNLIATAWESTIKIWDLSTGEFLHSFSTYQRTHSIAFSPNGGYLATGSMDTTAKVWDTSNWQCVQTLVGHQGWIMNVAFSPDRSTELITGSCDRTIKRWDLITGNCLETYTGHTNWVWSICYSPAGRSSDGEATPTIFSASEDGTIKIWDLSADGGEEIASQPLYSLELKPPYADTNITGATGLLLGQRQTLRLLGAIEN